MENKTKLLIGLGVLAIAYILYKKKKSKSSYSNFSNFSTTKCPEGQEWAYVRVMNPPPQSGWRCVPIDTNGNY